ncbi:MAG: YwiC-like family protein [Candidatus Marinimicrobia bacterium]|nr:YwiC-like family protein [Candidatus Neomarinimicrobiota bacterium]
MFLIPAVMAASLAGEWNWASLFLIASFILIFLSYEPAVRVVRRWKNKHILSKDSMYWIILFAGSGALIATAVFSRYGQWNALFFGCVVALTMMIHLWLTVNKQNMSIPGELVGVFGLTSSAPVIYLFLHQSMDARGWILWLINFLYFAGSIYYIKLKLRIQPQLSEPSTHIKIKKAVPLLVYNMILILFLWITIWLRGYTWLFLLAFGPYIIKSIIGIFTWQTKAAFNPKQTGFVELFHAIFFLIINILAFNI